MLTKPSSVPLAASLLTITLSVALPAQADSPSSYRISVPVVASTPVIERRTVVQPERTCRPVSRGYDSSGWRGGDHHYSKDYRGPRRGGYSSYGYVDRSGYSSRGSYRGGGNGGNNVGAQILGGVIGGVIGNQFGGGNGRRALTIAGAVLGSSIARDSSRRDRQPDYSQNRSYRGTQGAYEPEYVCHTSSSERVVEEVIGYDVTYSYNDTLHVRRMDYDPGEQIELSIRPIPTVPEDQADVPLTHIPSTQIPTTTPRRTL